MKKERQYRLVYWLGITKVKMTAPFQNINDAFSFIYEMNGLPLKVKYIGWK